MDICRTCLKTPAKKNISDLEKGLKEDNKNYLDIMMFCLDITVTLDSEITTKLCLSCYRKIISFFKFKALSLKNDVYLKSLDSTNAIIDQKSVYVDIDGVKHENLLDPDEFGPRIMEEDQIEIKPELDVKQEATENVVCGLSEPGDDPESDVSQNIEFEVYIPKVEEEKKAPVKKRNRPKKPKPTKLYKGKNKPKICEECGKCVNNLKEHSIQHMPRSSRPTLQCPDCPKFFYSSGALKKHRKVTHMGFRRECDICHKKVVCLSTHKLRHRPEGMPHACVSCGKRYLSRSELATHMLTHTQVLAFECDVCRKKFASKAKIKRHILKVHEKVKPHQCPSCPKSFPYRFELKNHLRSHTNERPFECEECGNRFLTYDNLKRHLPIHSAVKAFPCQLCDKTFAKNNYLQTHMISHTKEKKHPCQFCGVRFGRSDHRRRHEYTAHQKHLAS